LLAEAGIKERPTVPEADNILRENGPDRVLPPFLEGPTPGLKSS